MDNKLVNIHVKIRRREVLRRKLHLGRGEGNVWVGVPFPVRCPKKEPLRGHLGRPGIGGAQGVGGKGGSRETSQGAVARLWGSRNDSLDQEGAEEVVGTGRDPCTF